MAGGCQISEYNDGRNVGHAMFTEGLTNNSIVEEAVDLYKFDRSDQADHCRPTQNTHNLLMYCKLSGTGDWESQCCHYSILNT